MSFPIARILLLCFCTVSLKTCESQDAVEPEASKLESSRSVQGESEEKTDSTFRLYNLACDSALENYQNFIDHSDLTDVYSSLKKDLKANGKEYYIHKKVVPNHQGSVCQNLNITCCKPTMEKISETLAQDEYKFYYDEIFQAHSQTCQSPGKIFHNASIHIIRGLVQESEARLNQTTALKLPRDTFKDLSNFLSSYSSVPDICRLPDLVASQTQTLVEITLNSLFQDDEEYHHVLWDPESMKCAKNISISLVGEHQARILSVMQKHLLDLSLLSQSFRLAHNVISTIRRHSFSRSCIVSLTRMRYCPLCAGYGVKPCLFKCINTLRGCFADLAEVHSDFLGLISSLRVLSQDLIKEMRPNTFEDSYFNHFVSMVQDLWAQREFLKETLVSECGVAPDQNTTQNATDTPLERNKRGGSLYQPIQGSKSRTKQDPLLEQLNLDLLETVVEVEMGCLERVAAKMKDASNDICVVSKYNVAHKGNTQCWTGSTLGSYEHSKAGFLKADQLKNPEYADIPLSMELRYSTLIQELHAMTKKINATIAFNKVCLDSDDEDCLRNPFQHCTAEEDTFSGSGSGSGSGSNFSNFDTETTTKYVRVLITTPVVTVPTTERPVENTNNELWDEMPPPSTSTRPDNHGSPGVTTPRIGDIDNNIPNGGGGDRVWITPEPPKPSGAPGGTPNVETKPTTGDTAEVDTSTAQGRQTQSLSTNTGAQSNSYTTSTTSTTAEVGEDATDLRGTGVQSPAPPTSTTGSADTASTTTAAAEQSSGEHSGSHLGTPVISSSASPYTTPVWTIALLTTCSQMATLVHL